jgi:hypothetical protein
MIRLVEWQALAEDVRRQHSLARRLDHIGRAGEHRLMGAVLHRHRHVSGQLSQRGQCPIRGRTDRQQPRGVRALLRPIIGLPEASQPVQHPFIVGENARREARRKVAAAVAEHRIRLQVELLEKRVHGRVGGDHLGDRRAHARLER